MATDRAPESRSMERGSTQTRLDKQPRQRDDESTVARSLPATRTASLPLEPLAVHHPPPRKLVSPHARR